MNIYLFHSILIHSAFAIIILQLSISSKDNLNNKKYYIDFISSKPQVIEHRSTNNTNSNLEKKTEETINTKTNKEETKPTKSELKDKSIKKQIDDPDYLYKNISKVKPSMAEETPNILNEPINTKNDSLKTTPESSTNNGGSGIKTDNEFPYPWYISKLRAKLWDSWQEQTIIAKDVSVIIKFRIYRNGDIRDIEIDKSSGNKLFDYSALNSVIKIKNFEPLPSDFKDSYLTVYVEFKSTY